MIFYCIWSCFILFDMPIVHVCWISIFWWLSGIFLNYPDDFRQVETRVDLQYMSIFHNFQSFCALFHAVSVHVSMFFFAHREAQQLGNVKALVFCPLEICQPFFRGINQWEKDIQKWLVEIGRLKIPHGKGSSFSPFNYIYIYLCICIYICIYIYIYVIHMYISLLRWRVVNSTISLLPFPLFLTSWKHRMTWVLRIWPDRGNVPRMKQGDGVTIINSWDKTWLLLGKSIQIMDDLIKTKHDTSRILEPWSTHTFTPLHLWLSKQMEFGYDYKTTSNSHFFWKGHSSERVFEFVWK